MSHLKERKERNCLNCNAEVYGKYCHICGQENIEPKESFWSLITHFAYDVMHFDGKFFSTIDYLLLRPGFLSREYLRGRRASYLHPIRMYVFTSAIFFIIFFSFVVKPGELGKENNIEETNTTLKERIQVLQDSLNKTSDQNERRQIESSITILNKLTANDSISIIDSGSNKKDTSSAKDQQDHTKKNNIIIGSKKSNIIIGSGSNIPSTIKEYDSLQNKRLPDERDGWFTRLLMHKYIETNARYNGNSDEFQKDFLEKYFHSIPQMMFLSLPVVALLLQLLYIRRRKQFFYVDHVIFMIHVYIAVFISLLIYYGFSGLYTISNFSPFNWLANIIMLYIFLYCFWGMYKFYRQGIIKTFFKYFILLFLSSMFFVLLAFVFLITSFLQI